MPRMRHHVNPLKSEYVGGVIRAVPLPRVGEVEVELGCADALFLFQRARANPHVTCVGLEIRRDLVVDVNQRAQGEHLDNLRAVYANINNDLGRLLPDGRLARVFLNFPDPWFKRRHLKRRVLTVDVGRTIARKLEPGGVLLFQSDVWDLALDAMAVLEEVASESLLVNRLGPWSFTVDNPYGIRSLREERCEARGMRIWRMVYVKPSAASTRA